MLALEPEYRSCRNFIVTLMSNPPKFPKFWERQNVLHTGSVSNIARGGVQANVAATRLVAVFTTILATLTITLVVMVGLLLLGATALSAAGGLALASLIFRACDRCGPRGVCGRAV